MAGTGVDAGPCVEFPAGARTVLGFNDNDGACLVAASPLAMPEKALLAIGLQGSKPEANSVTRPRALAKKAAPERPAQAAA